MWTLLWTTLAWIPLAIAPAHAQAAGGGGDVLLQLMPLLLIFGVFYFVLIRPQQKKMKEHREMLASLKRNDRIVTGGGIVGRITNVRDNSDEIEVEIAPNVRVTVVRGTISSVIRPEGATGESAAKAG
ncbi:preprotein translocase subunit YajC [Caldovatus aquaticus]|uniref:Sec translocon accessory complex subunit YajC n=1 Tax=Caldovatus aquaticus TaxID=2865671 RepID=A0ABS7F341_9PROT|nr:preprotein translocase subunit YajC [Caldovatus aquaticus]MBW8270030.1 preprotein translocase subunit YajC [Caldovatus aquaticus]